MKLRGMIVPILLIAVSAANAQVKVSNHNGNTETMNKVMPGAAVNNADRRFFTEARVATVFNLRLSEIATRQANSEWAKEFAAMRLKDYAQNYSELKVIGSKVGMKVDKSLPAAWEKRLASIKAKRGMSFDSNFRSNFINVNEQYADQSERAVKSGNNSHIRNFAVTQGPVIRLNIKMATRKTTKI